MPQFSPTEFVTRLDALFKACQTEHSVYLTTKRLTRGPLAASAAGPSSSSSSSASAASKQRQGGQQQQHHVVFRASDGRSDGKATKFSTVVPPSELASFQASLSTTLRSNLVACLRKRDKARERRVDKALRESRKRLEEAGGRVKVSGAGSKRGAGHRKRQRAVKRAARVRREKAKAARQQRIQQQQQQQQNTGQADGGASSAPTSSGALARVLGLTAAESVR